MLWTPMALRSRLATFGSELKGAVAVAGKLATRRAAVALEESSGEPPVVARLVIEVRSDGTRTIARGALETDGEAVELEAHGSTPAQLARALTRTILRAPALLRRPPR